VGQGNIITSSFSVSGYSW